MNKTYLNHQLLDIYLWKNNMNYRRQITKKLLKQKIFIGKSKDEIADLCGIDENYYDLDEWAYFIKKSFWGGSTYLLLNFNPKNKVVKISKRTLYS